jgi:AcrR family transcriptional regulator
LSSAAEIFREKGYHHANLTEIAYDAGLQKGSLYYYIKSKEDLLYEIIMSALYLYIKSVEEILTSNKRADEVLKEAIIAHMYPFDIEFDRIYVFINELQNLSNKKYKKEVGTHIETYEGLWINIIEKGKRSGIFMADLDSKMTVLSIFALCNGSLKWYKRGGKYNIRDLAEMYSRNIIEGIKNNRGPRSVDK